MPASQVITTDLAGHGQHLVARGKPGVVLPGGTTLVVVTFLPFFVTVTVRFTGGTGLSARTAGSRFSCASVSSGPATSFLSRERKR